MGRASKDAEMKYTPGGMAICNFSLATSRKYKDRDDKWVEATEWHDCVIFSKRAEGLQKHIKKGLVYGVEGRLQTDKWEKDGVNHQRTKIVVDEFHFGGGGQGGGGYQQGGGQQNKSAGTASDDDDDIPF